MAAWISSAGRMIGLGLVVAIAAGCARAEIWPADADATPRPIEPITPAPAGLAPSGDWTVLRVGGEADATLTVTDGLTKTGDSAPFYRAGDVAISAALPVGYPPPTPPGAIELKRYDGVRQAVKTTGDGEGAAFFPLFRHISSRGIAMTAPVVMTGDMAGADHEPTSMAFLYRTSDMGVAGPAERGVVVEDADPVVVLSIGFQGDRSDRRLEDLRLTLDGWLFEQGDGGRWIADGPTRLLGYNGPDTSPGRKWWELQTPVRWAPDDADDGS